MNLPFFLFHRVINASNTNIFTLRKLTYLLSLIITCEMMTVNLHIKMINQCGYILWNLTIQIYLYHSRDKEINVSSNRSYFVHAQSSVWRSERKVGTFKRSRTNEYYRLTQLSLIDRYAKIHKTLTKLFEIWLSSWYLLHDINYFAFQQRYNNDASLERKIHHLIKFRPPFHNNTHYYIFLFVQFFHIPFRLDANNANEC